METAKALSPEEKPIIENIISLFQQLLSMQDAGTEPAAEEVAEMAETSGETGDQTMTEEDVKKQDGETGDSDAEERLEEQTNTTELSIQELGKALSQFKGLVEQRVAKSQKKDDSLVTKTLAGVAAALKQIVKKQDEQDQFNTMLLEALGVSDDVVQKAQPAQQTQERQKPIQNTDTGEVVKSILTEVFKNLPTFNQNPEYRHPFNQKKDVRKNLKSIAEYIHHTK